MKPKRSTPSAILSTALVASLCGPLNATGGELEAESLAPLNALPAFTWHDGTWTSGRPDGHAPIGVMGDHLHEEGEWMIALRAMRMEMEGSRDGTNSVSDASVVAPTGFNFAVTPTRMTMDMLMLGGMYAVSDELTMMAMVPYLQNEMDHVTRMGGSFTTESNGLGDVSIGGLYKLIDADDGTAMHANLALSVPTGSTDERDATPLGPNSKLPYPMQLGSGTFDLKPGLTWLMQSGDISYGAQGIATFRIGENSDDYRLGNRQDATAWAATKLSETVSTSARISYSRWSDIHGADPQIVTTNPMNVPLVPTAFPDLRAGERIDVSLGVNAYTEGGHRFALEFGVPVFQDLDGPQLETDWISTIGWQLAF